MLLPSVVAITAESSGLRSLVRVTGEPGDTARANRVLVTCREQFFREHGEAVRAAAGSEDRISRSSSWVLKPALDTVKW